MKKELGFITTPIIITIVAILVVGGGIAYFATRPVQDDYSDLGQLETGQVEMNTQTQNTDNTSTPVQPIINSSQKSESIIKENAKFKIGNEFVIRVNCENNNCDSESFKVLGYTQNISDPNRSAIIAYATTHYGNSSDICGWGNSYVPNCYIFTLNNNTIDKNYSWPDRAERDFPDSFKGFDLNNKDKNLYGQSFPHLDFTSSISYEGDNIKFLTRREDGCASFTKETWSLNIKTGLFSLLKSEIVYADGC